jgi:hypothetical protein
MYSRLVLEFHSTPAFAVVPLNELPGLERPIEQQDPSQESSWRSDADALNVVLALLKADCEALKVALVGSNILCCQA